MYFKTLRRSKTGLKFKELETRLANAFDEQKKMAESLGAKAWRGSAGPFVGGGISSLIFENEPDLTIYRRLGHSAYGRVGKDEFFPKRSSKQGKIIAESIDKMQVITNQELNSCVNSSERWKNIGFSTLNKIWVGFSISESWTNFKCPSDCIEITYSEYKRLFDKK